MFTIVPFYKVNDSKTETSAKEQWHVSRQLQLLRHWIRLHQMLFLLMNRNSKLLVLQMLFLLMILNSKLLVCILFVHDKII